MAASISTPSRLFLSYSKSPSNIHSPIRSIRFPRFPVAAMSVEAPQKSAAQSAFLDSKQSSLLHFVKYQGLGNDFILVDNRDTSEPRVTPEQAVKLCDRNFGVGADGVIFVMPGVGGTDYTMRIFNSDGSEPEMCGNGVRCFARFIAELEKLHGTQGEISCFVPTIKEEPPDVLLVCPDVDPQILPCAGLGNMHPRFGVGYEKLLWFLDAARTHPDELYTVGDYGYLGTTVTTILPCAGLGNMNPRFGVGYEKLLWFLDAVQTHPDELYTVGDYGYLGTTVTTVDNFGDAGSPPLNYIDGIQARSSYLTVGGGLGINHYNGGIIPPTLINLNNTACDFVPSQGGPLIIEHTNRIFRRISSHQILWISLLMAGSLFFFNPSIRSIIKIIISFIHSSDGNYIKLDTLMSLMQFFGLRRQSSAALFCSVGITSETRKSPFKLMSMMMGVAWFLLGSFKGSKHDLVNSALDQVKEKFATQQIPPPNTLLQLKFFLDFVTSGGGCTQISLFMVAIFHGKLFTVLAELFTVLAKSSFLKKNLDQHLKLRAEIPKHSKLRDIVFVAKTIADIQNHGEGKYNDQLHVQFDPVISSRESALLMVTCKVRAKDVDEYKERMSYLRLIVEGVIKDEQLYHGETWPVQRFF